MTADQLRMRGIAAECRQPDPVECYERQHSYEQSEAGPCLYCPVASWIQVMALSGRWAHGNLDVEEKVGLEDLALAA